MADSKPSLDDLRIHRPHKPASRSWAWMIVAAAVLLVVAFVVYHSLTGSRAIEVRTAVARERTGSGSDRTVLNASGYVTARRASTASSKVTGKVVEVLIEEGMKVKEGQVLARL